MGESVGRPSKAAPGRKTGVSDVVDRPDVLIVNTPADPLYAYSALGIRYLSAALKRAGRRVACVDCCLRDLKQDDIIRLILDSGCRLLGISAIEPGALGIIDSLGRAGFAAPVVLGGHFATFNYRALLERYPRVTCIVRGEGELTFLEVVAALLDGNGEADLAGVAGVARRCGGEVVANAPRPLIDDLDWLPLPDMDVLQADSDLVAGFTLTGSRGCFGGCGFCSVQSFYALSPGRRWRQFSPGRVVEELSILATRFGARDAWFLDDEFVGPGAGGSRWAAEVAEGIIKAGLKLALTISSRVDVVDPELFSLLKRAGLSTVLLGVENGSQEALARLTKGTTVEQNINAILAFARLGIDARLGWIMLDPATTLEEFAANLNFLEALDPRPYHRISVATALLSIYPGTPLAETYCRPRGVPLDESFQYAWEYEDPRVNELVRAAHAWLDGTAAHRRAILAMHEGNPRDVNAVIYGHEYARAYYTFLRRTIESLRTSGARASLDDVVATPAAPAEPGAPRGARGDAHGGEHTEHGA